MTKQVRIYFLAAVIGVLFSAAIAAAKGGFILDGTSYKARIIKQSGVVYVAVQDVAKALGKSYQVHNGTPVIGAPGGQSAEQATASIEIGKWGFNGDMRMRVVDVNMPKTCDKSILFEFSNGTNKPVSFHGNAFASYLGADHNFEFDAIKDGMFVGNNFNWSPDIPNNLPPAAHFKIMLCPQFSGDFDTLRVRSGKAVDFAKFAFKKPVNFKLKKSESK